MPTQDDVRCSCGYVNLMRDVAAIENQISRLESEISKLQFEISTRKALIDLCKCGLRIAMKAKEREQE